MATILRRSYKVKTADGRTVTRKCKVYTIQYFTANGQRKRHRGYTDLAATKQLAAKLEKAVALGAEGLVDPYKEQKGRPLSQHIAEYIADLKSTGHDAKYAANADCRLKLLAKECNWTTIEDITTNSFIRWRETRRTIAYRGTRADCKGTSATTLNQYRDTARAFLNWCATAERIDGIPDGDRKVSILLAGVERVKGEKVRKRRALSDDEVGRLLAAATPDRALVYRVGLAVGLRRAELGDLQWGDVRLNALPPFVQLRAEATKSGRADRVHFAVSLADDLRKHRPADAADTDPVFPQVPSLVLWRNDLEAAGIEWSDEQGQRADFHGGTRKTLCSRMHKAGVPLAVAMRTMRHTDARLTMIDYVDAAQLGSSVLDEVVAAPAVADATAAQAG